MRIYAEIYDNYEQLKATDNLMPPGMDPKVLKDYRLLLLDRVNGWRMSVNLTIFILSYPMPKIARLILLISEADTLDDATKGYNHIFECIDYLFQSLSSLKVLACPAYLGCISRETPKVSEQTSSLRRWYRYS